MTCMIELYKRIIMTIGDAIETKNYEVEDCPEMLRVFGIIEGPSVKVSVKNLVIDMERPIPPNPQLDATLGKLINMFTNSTSYAIKQQTPKIIKDIKLLRDILDREIDPEITPARYIGDIVLSACYTFNDGIDYGAVVSMLSSNVTIGYRCAVCGEIIKLTDDHAPMYFKFIESMGICCDNTLKGREDEVKKTHELLVPLETYNKVMATVNRDMEQLRADNMSIPGTFAVRFINEVNPNRHQCKLSDRGTLRCKHNHVSNIPEMRISMGMKPLRCSICENIKDIEFFKLLDELGAEYSIVEQIIPRSALPNKLDAVERKIIRYMIFTRNKKKHLTGKIVFDDYDGLQQTKSNINNLVFRWMDTSRVNDREYCKTLLHAFYHEINVRHGLV